MQEKNQRKKTLKFEIEAENKRSRIINHKTSVIRQRKVCVTAFLTYFSEQRTYYLSKIKNK